MKHRLGLVAVPANAATWEKFVQPDPVQRSILTSVWAVVPFVHCRPIDLLVSLFSHEQREEVVIGGREGAGRRARCIVSSVDRASASTN